MKGHGVRVKLGLSTESCSEKGELSRSADGAAAAWERAVQRETGQREEGGQREGGGQREEGGQREGGPSLQDAPPSLPHPLHTNSRGR